MKQHIPLLVIMLLAYVQSSNAELKLDPTMKPRQVEVTIQPLFKSVVRSYGDQHSADFGGGASGKMSTFSHDNDKFAWLFNGKKLFSVLGSFTPEIAPLADCSDLSEPRCAWRREGFKVCHLFMFDNDLKLETVTRLNIERDIKLLKGLPRCRTVQAMATAKTIPDAMLITLGYIDSAEPADKNYDPPELYTTLLLRFSEANGKLNIEQDDSCLGNPNKIRTIAVARKRLEKCASSIPQTK